MTAEQFRAWHDPIIDGKNYYTYHRKPTKSEIAFGYGAVHYLDITPERVVKKRVGPLVVLKKWTIVDGLRYYR